MTKGYYVVYAQDKRTRKGLVSLKNSGLGEVMYVKKSNLKKVQY